MDGQGRQTWIFNMVLAMILCLMEELEKKGLAYTEWLGFIR